MEYIYKAMLRVDLLGNHLNYEYRAIKVMVKGITEKNVIIDGKRIKRNEIGLIQFGSLINSTHNINYEVWFEDESKIEYYKPLLLEKVVNQINTYRIQLNRLEEALLNEPEYTFRDRTLED